MDFVLYVGSKSNFNEKSCKNPQIISLYIKKPPILYDFKNILKN